jgi:hypothetical protein
MTAAGTFALDTNTYLTSSAIASTTNLLSGDGSGNAVSSGIAASNVALLNAANTFTNGPQEVSIAGAVNNRYFRLTDTSSGGHQWDLVNRVAEVAGGFGFFDNTAGEYRLSIDGAGNVGIGTTAPAALLSVGSSSQFQVNSAGVSSAGAGSTDYSTASSAQVAHCLADGTGGGSCGGDNANATQTTVSCSTAGTATFSEPFTGASYKKVIYSVSGCQGTVSYTFPVAFTTGTTQLSQAGGANTVTNTSITWGSVSALTAIGVIEGW